MVPHELTEAFHLRTGLFGRIGMQQGKTDGGLQHRAGLHPRAATDRHRPHGTRTQSLHGAERKSRFAEIPVHDVVLTTYPLLWRDAEALHAREWSLLILDEAQTVKNAASKGAQVIRQIKARHRLGLTGTPLENHLGELWAQFDFLLPGFLGTHKQFTATWRTPIEKHGDDARLAHLRARIRPFLLRRTKEQVATMLQTLLGFEELPLYLDATDGLAAAVCHYFQSGKATDGTGSIKTKTTRKTGWKAFLSENPDRLG